MHAPVCPRCNQELALESFLEAVSGYSVVTNSGGSICPECHEALEFRVADGCLQLGYTYWAGSLHFDAVSSFEIAGLRLDASRHTLTVTFNGRSFPIPSSGRY